MAANDLTTLARVREWVGPPDNVTSDDNRISTLIMRASDIIRAYLNRDSLLYKSYSETYDGYGRAVIVLRNYPALAVSSVKINGVTIPAASAPGTSSGFWLEPWDGFPPGNMQRLLLTGYCFSRGLGNVSITYSAGYAVIGEAQTVDATLFTVTPSAPNGILSGDVGVTYANGAALTKVASSPAAGQYVAADPLNAKTPIGVYTFNPADANAAVLLSYSYVPFSVESACCNMVGERMSYRQRIGQSTKSLGGVETTTYKLEDITAHDKMSLSSYRRVGLAY